VSIAGPAGYQYSEQAPEPVWVWQAWVFAWANWTVGSLRDDDIGPARLAIENVTRKIMRSFNRDLLFKEVKTSFRECAGKNLSQTKSFWSNPQHLSDV